MGFTPPQPLSAYLPFVPATSPVSFLFTIRTSDSQTMIGIFLIYHSCWRTVTIYHSMQAVFPLVAGPSLIQITPCKLNYNSPQHRNPYLPFKSWISDFLPSNSQWSRMPSLINYHSTLPYHTLYRTNTSLINYNSQMVTRQFRRLSGSVYHSVQEI